MTQKEPVRPEPQVLLEGIVGSRAYGLATPTSDVDRRGIFLAPVTSLLRLEGLPKEERVWVGSKAGGDRELTELGKFCSLVLGGNPTYTELLWLPENLYLELTPLADELIAMRDAFLSARTARDSYFGYATQQFKKLEDREGRSFSSDTAKRTEKHARHMARLLFQGFNLWATGRIIVRLPDHVAHECRAFGQLLAPSDEEDTEFAGRLDEYLSGSRDTGSPWLRGVIAGQRPRTRMEVAQRMLSYWEDAFDNTRTILPDRPNREVVDRWLTNLRLEQARNA